MFRKTLQWTGVRVESRTASEYRMLEVLSKDYPDTTKEGRRTVYDKDNGLYGIGKEIKRTIIWG